jgi:hypothetical protein
MNNIIYPFCAVLAWLAFIYKLPRLRQQRDSSLLTLCAAFALLAATFTISTPAVWVHIDGLIGYPNISALFSQGCVLIFAASLQVLLLLWLNPREEAWAKIRPRSLAFGVVLALMAALWFMAPATPENPTDFVASHAGQPYFAAYLLLYVAAFTVMQIEVARLCLRYARSCGRPWLRRGLLTTTAGALLGLVYCLGRTADVAGALAGLNPLTWEALPRLGAGGGEVLYLIGWTMPSWGPKVSAGRAWLASYRAHHHLYPLWAALYQLAPHIALDPPKPRILEILNFRDLDFRLHRRVIEIQDGRLALRPYLSAAAPATAPAQAEEDRLDTSSRIDAATEAMQLRIAMNAKASNMPPLESAAAQPPAPAGQDDFHGEIKRLVAVAQAFNRCGPAAKVTDRDNHPQEAM